MVDFDNPWGVDDIAAFSFFCCPECVYRAKTVPDFQVHAIINHPHSKDFFDRYGDKYWDQHNGDLPSVDDFDLDAEPIDIKVEPDVKNSADQLPDENSEQKLVTETEEPSKFEDDDADHILDDLINNDYKPEDLPPAEPVSHKCNHCEEYFDTIADLRKHKSKVHGKKESKYQCTVCDLQCPNRSKLKTHIEEVHEKRKVPCPQCNKSFSKGGLRNHIKYYHDVDRVTKPFKCDECDFASHALKYLKAHKLNCHDKSKQKYKCDQCGDRFPFPSHLKLHQCRGTKSSKSRGGPVKCPECNQELKARQYLINHFKKVNRTYLLSHGTYV